MNKIKTITGIELGSSKITTLVAQQQKDEISGTDTLNIIGVSSVPSEGIKRGQIVNIEEAVEATVASIEGAERMAGYSLDRAYVAVGGASITSQNSHGVVAVSNPEGEINAEDVDRVIEAASAISLPASKEVIHILPREYVVDGEKGVKDPVGMSGIRLEVDTHIISASSATTKNIRKAISNEVGLNIENLVFSGLASSYSVLTETEKELGCVLVDIGGGTTSISCFIDGALTYSGALPIGAKNVTSDLAIGLRVSLETAEKIKLSLSNNKNNKKESDEMSDVIDLAEEGVTEIKKVSKKTLSDGIIRPRLNEIFTMVRIALEKEGLINSVPSGVIVTGGGAKTIGVSDCAKRMMSLPVRVGSPKGVGGLVDDIMDPSYATAIGLLLYGVKNSTNAENSSSFSFGSKIKLPTKGIAGKIIESIRDLLP